MQPRKYSEDASRFIPALVLIAIGAIFLLNNLHIIYVREWLRYWPVVLIAAGLFAVVDSDSSEGRAGGGILVALGAAFLAQSLGYLDGLRWVDLWPLVLIAAGIMLLVQRVWGPPPRGCRAHVSIYREDNDVNVETNGGRLHLAAVFGGGKRKISMQNFRRGRVSAVFGGFEIDLRKAAMAGDSAELHITAVFGGAEVKIPSTWSAVVEGHGAFGAFQDDTAQPDPDTPGLKRLYVTGGAVFGGVVVRN